VAPLRKGASVQLKKDPSGQEARKKKEGPASSRKEVLNSPPPRKKKKKSTKKKKCRRPRGLREKGRAALSKLCREKSHAIRIGIFSLVVKKEVRGETVRSEE